MGYSSSVVSIPDVGWLRTLDSLYTEENFEGLRAMLLRISLDRACTFMGGDFLDEFLSYNGMDLQSTWYTYIFADVMLVNLLNTMYCDHVADPEAAALVESLFYELKDAMSVRISVPIGCRTRRRPTPCRSSMQWGSRLVVPTAWTTRP